MLAEQGVEAGGGTSELRDCRFGRRRDGGVAGGDDGCPFLYDESLTVRDLGLLLEDVDVGTGHVAADSRRDLM